MRRFSPLRRWSRYRCLAVSHARSSSLRRRSLPKLSLRKYSLRKYSRRKRSPLPLRVHQYQCRAAVVAFNCRN